ncbi:uncharacterized protein N7511_001737 [Penicillium nucicola]|uniref:uncharacterized protein n=1 Tax=Penicillium nucicola TaxID=1850975 RepID=UPI002544F27E|nr:uncharacterized protein N7511_001737 [Penicillium nucicola]KAJ5776726.1 hypothetical protein N7511_001737 [Penicillium nucicola]
MMLDDYRANANTTDSRSRTPIFYAVRTKNEQIIRILLENKEADINWQDQHRQTPLVYAIERNLLPTASLLLEFNPYLIRVDIKKRSAIWYAIARCDESLVQALLKRGSDIRTPDYKDFSPICLAVTKKPPNIARLILLNSDPDSRKILLKDVALRNSLLRRAVQASLQDVIALLVAHGADPNSRNRDGQSLLHQATKNGDREVVQQLLTYEDISINATDRRSCTALHIAAEYGCTSVAKCLLAKCGIESSARDTYGRTAFHIAAEYGNKLITRLFLAYGVVDINARDANGATALCLAVKEKHTAAALQILAEDHVDLNVAGQNGWTALHHAVSVGSIPVACVLLNNDQLDPNLRDDEGWPPLTHAASNGDLRMVELLLARTNIQVNVHQAPPLFHAAKHGHVEVVRRLLSFDTIDINQQFWNSSPLCVASEMGYPEVTKLLLRHTDTPDTNLKTYLGDTALSLAAYHGHLVIIHLLLEVSELDVAAADKFGDTALCKAARNGHEQAVKRLYRDTRAKCAIDVKRAAAATSNCRIALYLEGHLDEEGNFCTWP